LKDQEDKKVTPQIDKINNLITELQSSHEDTLILTCQKLHEDEFVPWYDKQKQVNKLFFAERGGIKYCIRLITDDFSVKLKSEAGTVLWCFAETGQMIEVLWRDRAVDAMLILLQSGELELEKVALGFFMCFLEYDTNAHVATCDKSLVPTIISIAKKRQKKELKGEFQRVLTGTLFVLCIHPLTSNQLLHLGVIDILLQTKDNDLLISYFVSLGIAYLLSDEKHKVNKKKKTRRPQQDILFHQNCHPQRT